jgi:hypothetical protein
VTEYAGWSPYVGAGAIFLAIILLAIGALLAYFGMRLTRVIRIQTPARVVGVFAVLTWGLSLGTLLVFYGFLAELGQRQQAAQPPNPITPFTILFGIISFIIIGYLSRAHGVKVALGSAFVGTAAAPMIFELPFDLIVIGRTNAPLFTALLFFLPLFLVEVSTMSLLLLSPLTNLSKSTMFSLSGMFIVFAVWALFGFSYPSNPLSFTLNVISKVLSFTTAITLFLNTRTGS